MTTGKNYLITGGFGLIGSTMANSLDGNIVILSRSENKKRRITRNYDLLLKDLNDLTSSDLKKIDVIYHFASTVDNYNILENPYIDIETNITATVKLLELCKNLERKPKIIYTSTFFVYGNEYDKSRKPINEESKTDPLAIYPATKLCTENIIKLYGRLYQIPYVICRLTNVYSENEDYNNKKKGALNYLIMKAIKGDNISVYNDGNFYRDYIYIDDVIQALKLVEKKGGNDLFLVGNGKAILFRDIVNYILEITQRKSRINSIEPPLFHKAVGINSFVADINKIKKLGFVAKIDYKEGIKRIVEKYKNYLSL